MNTIGATLKDYRIRLSVKMETIANDLQVHKSQISRLEAGDVPIKRKHFVVYCINFGISEDVVIEFADSAFGGGHTDTKDPMVAKAVTDFLHKVVNPKLRSMNNQYEQRLKSLLSSRPK